MTAVDVDRHGRSECALHRWDIVGRDDVGWAILGQAELTHHALGVLDGMATLAEARREWHRRAAAARRHRGGTRSPGDDDVVECTTRAPVGVADLELDPAARLLLLWGRREPSAPIRVPERDGPAAARRDARLARPSV